jgi:hypothetical protein
MANTIDDNKVLQEAYLPHQAAVVRLADAGPVRGRNSLARAEERKRHAAAGSRIDEESNRENSSELRV